jgi:hypothetical protein
MQSTPDALVQSFLKEAKRSEVSALVAYGLVVNGRPVLRIASNTEEAASQGLWNWLTKLDDRAIEAAAKTIAFMAAGEGKVPAPEGAPTFETPDELWELLSEEMRTVFTVQAQKIIAAAKGQQGRTMNIVKPDGKPA